MTDFDLFQQWLKKLENKIESQKQFGPKKNSASLVGKRYSHFDHPVTLVEASSLQDYFLNTDLIAKHTFYPFIKVIIRKQRYLTDKTTHKRTKHPDGPKDRPICYAAHHDSLVFSWYAHKLDVLLEKEIVQFGLDKSILAYRSRGLNNVQFAKEVFDYISTKSECVALAFDVSKFFDTLSHKHLKQAWAALLGGVTLPKDHHTIFKAMTRFRYIEAAMIQAHLSKEKLDYCEKLGRYFYPEDFRKYLAPLQETNQATIDSPARGIPQGSPLSAVLSNLYMLTMDMQLAHFAEVNGGIYRRYCDDLLMVLPQVCAVEAEELVEAEFLRLRLKINPDKTERRFFSISNDDGAKNCVNELNKKSSLQYLGLEYDGREVRIRPASLIRHHQRLRKGVRNAVRKALSKKSTSKQKGQVFRRKLYEKYTHLGRSNFISYVYNAYKHTASMAMKRQIRGSVERINQCIKHELIRQTSWKTDKQKLRAEDKREASAPSARVMRMNFDIL